VNLARSRDVVRPGRRARSHTTAAASCLSTMVVAKRYREGMAVNMHIRDLDEPTHRELVRRADAAGMSLRSYVIEVLHRHAALPTLEEWLDEVRADPPLPSEGPDSVTLVEEGRRDIDVA
jgi:plasmid stability protein